MADYLLKVTKVGSNSIHTAIPTGLPKDYLIWQRYGPHQDYLRKQDLVTRTRLLTEFAAELLVQPGANPDQLARVCREVATGQMLTTLLDYGQNALGSALKSDPTTVFRLFNTICNVSEPRGPKSPPPPCRVASPTFRPSQS